MGAPLPENFRYVNGPYLSRPPLHPYFNPPPTPSPTPPPCPRDPPHFIAFKQWVSNLEEAGNHLPWREANKKRLYLIEQLPSTHLSVTRVSYSPFAERVTRCFQEFRVKDLKKVMAWLNRTTKPFCRQQIRWSPDQLAWIRSYLSPRQFLFNVLVKSVNEKQLHGDLGEDFGKLARRFQALDSRNLVYR